MAEQQVKKSMTRGQFMGAAFFGFIGLLGLEALIALSRFLKPVSTAGFGGLVYAGKVEEFGVDSVSYVMEGRFWLVRNQDGFLALWQKCPHLGCAVPWAEAQADFHCPCHGSIFNTVGEVVSGPAPRPMDYFQVLIRSAEVWVDTSKPIQRREYDPSQVAGA